MKFPHLYRCGHIEGVCLAAVAEPLLLDFRIFIDAATLKGDAGTLSRLFLRHFRIFIDAATLKAFDIGNVSDNIT